MNIAEMKPEEMDQYIKHTIMEQMDSPMFTNTIHQLINTKVALQLQDLKLKVIQQEKEIANLKSDLVKQENYSRRSNLEFHFVKDTREETKTDLHGKLMNMWRDAGIVNPEGIRLERFHRQGNYNPSRPRMVFVRFAFFEERLEVSRVAKQLDQLGVHLMQNFHHETQQNRRQMIPIIKTANKTEEHKGRVQLRDDNLLYDGRRTTIDKLPADLQPRNICTPRDDNTVVFLRPASPLSNLHPCKINIEGAVYNSTCQYLAVRKARAAGDRAAEEEIMATKDTYKIMFLHKGLKDKLDGKWDHDRSEEVLTIANKAKYEQNVHLRDYLKATGSRRIGEASLDKEWGVGLKLHSRDQLNQAMWTGRNRMGKVLETIRTSL